MKLAGDFEGTEEKSDELERERIDLQSQKIKRDYEIKARQLAETVRKDKAAEELKKKELEIRKKQASRPAIKNK